MRNKCFAAIPLSILVVLGGLSPTAAADLDPVRCLIEPDETIELSTPVAGIVASVSAGRGDRVTAGQEVARLDARVEEITLELALARAEDDTAIRAAEARLAYAQDMADRNAALAERNAISQSTAREAALEAEIARQDLAEARLNRDLAAIEARQAGLLRDQKILRSPVDGLVTEKLVSPGEYRDGQSHVVTIARMDRLRVEAFVPTSYYPHLALGQTVTIRPEPPVGGAFEATITVIDQVFDAATATFGIRMALPNPDLALPAGLRCDVEFPSG